VKSPASEYSWNNGSMIQVSSCVAKYGISYRTTNVLRPDCAIVCVHRRWGQPRAKL